MIHARIRHPDHRSEEIGQAITIDVRRLFDSLRRHLSIVALSATVVLGGAATFLAFAPSRYIATAQILVDPRGLQVLDREVSPRAQNSDVQVPLVESEMRVLKSSRVLDVLIDRENLDRDPEFTKGQWSPVGAVKALATQLLGRERPQADARLAALGELEERIAVRRAERSFVIDVSVATADPLKSAHLANALVQAYVEQNSAAQAEIARRSGSALMSRLDELRTRVRDAEERVEQFKAANNIVGAAGRLVSEQQLAELNNQLGVARTRTAEARAKVEQIERLRAGDLGAFAEAVQSQTVMALRVQHAEINRRYADLATKLGTRHPDLAAVERELRDAQSGVAMEVARIARAARADYDRARASEQAQERSLDLLKRAAVSTSQDFVKLRELEREVDASRAIYQAALVRSRELTEQTSVDTTNVRHITVASPPLRPANAPASLVLPIALAGGLLVGSAVAFALGTLDPKVRSREDLERATGLRVLAGVPSGAPDARLTPHAPQGAGGKAFQSLLDEIGAAYGSVRPQSIGIASVDADGSSGEAAFNLALAAAESGHRVLLIDAAVEQRQLTRRLAFDGQAGLGTCAANGAELASVVIPVPGAAIDFVAADPQAPAEIRRVGARSLPQLAREAGTPYGLVVLDLGCVAREPIARTAASAEATVLLVGLDHSALEATKAAVAALRSGTARLVGLALTGGRMRAG